jgi:hypothetical protein
MQYINIQKSILASKSTVGSVFEYDHLDEIASNFAVE